MYLSCMDTFCYEFYIFKCFVPLLMGGKKKNQKSRIRLILLLVPLCLRAGSTVQFHDSEVYGVFNQVKE